jgi:hypothetical protein
MDDAPADSSHLTYEEAMYSVLVSLDKWYGWDKIPIMGATAVVMSRMHTSRRRIVAIAMSFFIIWMFFSKIQNLSRRKKNINGYVNVQGFPSKPLLDPHT